MAASLPLLPAELLIQILSYLPFDSQLALKLSNSFISHRIGTIPIQLRLEFILNEQERHNIGLPGGVRTDVQILPSLRACVSCVKLRPRAKFSRTQLRHAVTARKCMDCLRHLTDMAQPGATILGCTVGYYPYIS